MKISKVIFLALLLSLPPLVSSQATAYLATKIAILKAEDSRAYDDRLAILMKSPNAAVRVHTALAAGRIGDDRALDVLYPMLARDASTDVREMAAFAIGEVESAKNANGLLDALTTEKQPSVRGRIIEAAGKIAAAHPTNAVTPALKRAIVDELRNQTPNNTGQNEQTIRLAMTAALRARPEGADEVIGRFLDGGNSRIVADAGNALTRLRAKNAGDRLRRTLKADPDGVARANAARALGAAEDKGAIDDLLNAALKDADERVRVSAIRSLAALKDAKAAPRLIDQGTAYLKSMDAAPGRPHRINELLEIASSLGRLQQNTENESAIGFLRDVRLKTDAMYGETEIALARVGPKAYIAAAMPAGFGYSSARQASAYAQGLGAIAETKDTALIAQASQMLRTWTAGIASGVRPGDQAKMAIALPDVTTALAALKPLDLNDLLIADLGNNDPFLRAAAAGSLADLPATRANTDALKTAFAKALRTDKHDNDSQLAIIDALHKLDKKESVSVLLSALAAPDYLVRRRAFTLLADPALQKDFPAAAAALEKAKRDGRDRVLPYAPSTGTKLGQILNTEADYRRALLRKNGSVRAILTTEKGPFTIEFFPEDAPLTVDNFVRLARTRYFDGLEVHRVVPNFVMQDGDPRGDGNGGPGWSIRCELNIRPYDRGAVGMALSGKDTGGSQWFVTHSPQPHLDGGYTVFGRVDEPGMKVVDKIVRGDRIVTVRIVGR